MTELIPYQTEAVNQIQVFNGRCLLALEQSLGKTIVSLTWAINHLEKWPAVVVTPASLKYHWQREAEKHVDINDAVVFEGRRFRPKKIPQNKRLYVINYDILDVWLPFFVGIDPGLVIGDEAHLLKTRNTRRTKSFRSLVRSVPHVILATGTPLTNRPAELWPLLNILQPKEYSSFFSYAMRYTKAKKTFFGWDYSGAANLGELHAKLCTNIMIRKRKVEVLKDLPEKQRFIVPLALSNQKEYTEAERDIIAWLRKYNRSKAKRAEKAKRLSLVNELKRLVGRLKIKPIIEWVENFFEETDEKLLLFAVHKVVVRQIHEHFKYSVRIDGSVTGKKRQVGIDNFLQNENCRLLVGNITAAGVGWSATGVNNVAFAELPWTPAEVVQAEDRCHGLNRGKVDTHTFVHYLLGLNTIEEKILQTIQKKQRILDQTVDGCVVDEGFDVFDILEKELLKKGE